MAVEIVAALASEGLEALIDPFGPGIQVGTRIDEVRFESLLFVASTESVQSSWCLRELGAALRFGVPVFSLRMNGVALPPELSDRIVVDVEEPPSSAVITQLRALAVRIRQRATVWGALRVVRHADSADEQRLASEWLELDADPTALSEELDELESAWSSVPDDAAAVSLVRTISRVRSSRTCEVLRRLRKSERDHARRIEVAGAIDDALRRVCGEIWE